MRIGIVGTGNMGRSLGLLGFEPIDCGLLRQARLLESAGDLKC